MKKIPRGYIIPSAAYTIPKRIFHYIPAQEINRIPQVGDVVYGKVEATGQHTTIENCNGRIHGVHDNTRSLFVFGNRYAPDYYEGKIPTKDEIYIHTDLLARSGIIGNVISKNVNIKEPTKIKIIGWVTDKNGEILNTLNYTKVKPSKAHKKNKVILSIGTAMNSGKTTTAKYCCWALSKAGHPVTATKITGTASLKDILGMQDCGAEKISDFTYMGYPSTYMMDQRELITMFNLFDQSNNETYWVIEFADGILQRETKMLLQSEDVTKRLHKILFSAHDTFAALGGINILKNEFGLVPDLISGIISGSPLLINEFRGYSSIPIINNMDPKDFKDVIDIIL